MIELINDTISSREADERNIQDDVFLERIPDEVYQEMVAAFSDKYHFQNGERMRIANYFVGISSHLANDFILFIEEMSKGLTGNKFPIFQVPNGFEPSKDNLLPTEQIGGFSLGSFDMAVTEEGLQNIEFQAVATYPVSAAMLNQHLLEKVIIENAYPFADSPQTTMEDFKKLYKAILAGDETEGVILTDRKIKEQKTNFEFFATQQELDSPIDIVDMENLFEKDGELWYDKSSSKDQPLKVTRLYNRILLAEALFEDNYPADAEAWKFRFDKKYKSLKFVNHPVKQFEVSKRLCPYINHSSNPDSFELSEVASLFRQGTLAYEEYIWKHKWGAAGHRLILSPTLADLESLSDELADYIVQKKVNFKIFKTDDGQEKIVELRFMTAHHQGKSIIVPMARLGHVTEDKDGLKKYKIHFGDNNKEGYGFSPVVIFK